MSTWYRFGMATARTYEDSCGVAHALELVGERWALLVVRELMLGAKRFGDIKQGLPGISANVLSHRLDELERAGLVRRRKLPKPAAVWVYELKDNLIDGRVTITSDNSRGPACRVWFRAER